MMHNMSKAAILAMLALPALAGCARYDEQHSQTIPLKDALDIVSRQIRDASPIMMYDIADQDMGQIRDAIFAEQCFYRAADPAIPVITGPISLGLQGSIQRQSSGGITIASLPSGTYSYQVAVGEQQSLTVPISYVSLRGLPNFVLGQDMSALTGLSSGDPERRQLVASLIQNRDNLAGIVGAAIEDFQPPSCPAEDATAPPIAPLAHPQR